jgi:hypothetical protein
MLIKELCATADADRGMYARIVRTLIVICTTVVHGAVPAQGGPPVVTDDPDTPGDGHWEINVGAIGEHTRNGWAIAAPDADINYGWGDHVQLKVDVPWTTNHERGEPWKSGLGTGFVGVKWRFIDQENTGFAMSTYPQFGHSILRASTRRGLAGHGSEFFLPIEVSTDLAGFGLAVEAGRNFVQKGADGWEAGVVGAHSCGGAVECIAEAHFSQIGGDWQTLLNFGVHWKLDEAMKVLAAAGRDLGARSNEQRSGIFYLGLQFTR